MDFGYANESGFSLQFYSPFFVPLALRWLRFGKIVFICRNADSELGTTFCILYGSVSRFNFSAAVFLRNVFHSARKVRTCFFHFLLRLFKSRAINSGFFFGKLKIHTVYEFNEVRLLSLRFFLKRPMVFNCSVLPESYSSEGFYKR